jgi:hypothetical protein
MNMFYGYFLIVFSKIRFGDQLKSGNFKSKIPKMMSVGRIFLEKSLFILWETLPTKMDIGNRR